MDIATIMENISETDLKDHRLNYKKSILNQKGHGDVSELKRDNSKIQWMEVPEKTEEERKFVKSSVPVLGILASRGYRWHYIHDAMLRLRCEEMKQAVQSEEKMLGNCKKAFNNLIQDLGSGVLQKRYNKNTELTLNQQSQLEILKHKVKIENDAYLRRHSEIDLMMKLVYAALFKHQPKTPKKFVSDYIHHLNKHREELVVNEVNVPFDQPYVPEEITPEEEEKRLVSDFAKQIVEDCINIAIRGESYIDVMIIISSLLNTVTQSESETTITSVISNAENAVSKVLMSLLTSVAMERSTSAELVVDELLDIIWFNTLSFVPKDNEVYLEMKNSVENFITKLLEKLIDEATNKFSIEELMEEPETTETERYVDGTGKSILRRDYSPFQDEEFKTKSKVKFQSFQAS